MRDRKKLRKLVFDHYGWSCSCCGESMPFVLTIDHINEDGAKHRREVGSAYQFYRWLYDQSLKLGQWPAGFQTLCRNCNYAKYRNGGICPHEDNKEFVRFDNLQGWGIEGPNYDLWDE